MIRALLFIAFACQILAAEKIPSVPTRYFNDYAGVVSAPTVQELNSRLEQFEKDTSSQILVAVYPKMESDDSIESYTVRVANAWKVGQKEKRNGAILFVFVNDRKMYLQVGYGLEGAIPDATAKQITEFEIKPHFKNNNYDAGLRAGVNAILQAARGEYKGTGRTANQQRQRGVNLAPYIVGFILLMWFMGAISNRRGRRRGRVYRRSGWDTWGSGWGGTWGGGGGSWGGGSWGGGGGGGFSSGGGSFGGGGAGSSW